DYTFENVRAVGRAIASYVLKNEDSKKGLVVGYDTRFASQRFAEAISEELAGRNLDSARQRLHSHPGHLLCREEPGYGRRSHDHQQSQSVVVERREVQGPLRRLSDACADQADRAGT